MTIRTPVLLLTTLALAAPAAANATVHVARGETVNEIKVLGDDVRVDGHVRGWVTVIDGSLVVGRTGSIGNASVIGGRLVTESGGRIRGEVFQFGGLWPQPDSWLALLTIGAVIRFLVVAVAVAAAELLAARPISSRLSGVAATRPLRTLLVGALAVFGLSAGSIVLALTVLGLPIAAAIWALLLVASVVGTSFVISAGGGERRVRRLALIVLAIPVLGDGLLILLAAVGLGALLTYLSDPRPTLAASRMAQSP